MESKHLLLLLPIGAFIYILLSKNNPGAPENPSAGKEEYYLRYNKDEIMKNLIASEGHFRNVADDSSTIEAGFLSCVVKHLADAEGHVDEAISHAAVVEGHEASEKFRNLRDNIRELRYKVQKDVVIPYQGILDVRKIRREFESFNPEYDISTCESCIVRTTITDKDTEKVRVFNP